jgi:hypothetical protein
MMIEYSGWLIEGQLAGTGRLIHHEELQWLRKQGISAIVSLTEHSLRREKLLLRRLDSLGFPYRCITAVQGLSPLRCSKPASSSLRTGYNVESVFDPNEPPD